ncbi:MAG: F0F1 ATP synthase subunit A [Holosporaceae bacterium]|jgi:F-type H+-transporting ATPase subunit a|nr:F0F1 ATP synthase subunit A [Holosporaceae bacterium]
MIDPLHQFTISPILKIDIGGVDLSFTNSSLSVLVTLVAVCAILSIFIGNKKLIPDRMQASIEMLYEAIADMIDTNIGKSGQHYFPFVFSVFLFVLFGNLVGIIPYMFTFTSHIIATFTIAIIVFIFITILGVALHGLNFLSLFAPSGVPKFLLPLLIPIEMISYLSKPISLSIRLFANIMAGHTVMKVFAGFAAMLGILGIIPVAINIVLTGFEIFMAILQAYIFTMLTCVYLNDTVHLH